MPQGRQPIMPNPNAYECKQCGAKFDTREQLDGHNRREHPSGSKAGTTAGSGGGYIDPSQKKNM
jgi:predicted nucleic acid-binding Zn ribbon protein